MQTRGAKILLVVLAAVVLALGFVAYWILAGSDQGTDAREASSELSGAERRGSVSTAESAPGAPSATAKRRAERSERRRFRNEQQRKKLIAAIELARAARMRGRVPAADWSGSAEDRGEGLSKESVRDAVQAVIEDVKACYEEQLRLSPELGGKIVVDFTINAEEGVGGVVDRVEVNDESDEPMRLAGQLTECIIDTIYTLELPSPDGGGTVDVSYPLYMRPGDPDARSE